MLLNVESIREALGALEQYSPTGAWGMMGGGRAASRNAVALHINKDYAKKLAQSFVDVEHVTGVPREILAALASRETHFGFLLDKDGLGDHGNGFGIMQVDKRYHRPKGTPWSLDNIIQGAGIWSDYYAQVKAKHSSWDPRYWVKGACVAYNSGVDNVGTINRMDAGTTGADYGADVCARAQHLGSISGYWPEDPDVAGEPEVKVVGKAGWINLPNGSRIRTDQGWTWSAT